MGLSAVAAESETCESHGIHYDCVTESLEETTVRLPYENGTFGSLAPANLTSVDRSWPPSLAPGDPIPSGVSLQASFETSVLLAASNNGSASPTTGSAVVYDASLGLVPYGRPVVFALQWHARINSTLLMNGATNYYVRSPLIWQDDYVGHVLNVLDEDGRVVAARSDLPGDTTVGAFNDSLLHERRLYYHIRGLLRTDEAYTFNEYVLTHGTPPTPLASVLLAAAPHQDIDGDGTMETRVFPGAASENYVKGLEPAYSFRFVYGTGPGGSVNLLEPVPGAPILSIRTDKIRGVGGTGATNHVQLLMPFRLSMSASVEVLVYQYDRELDATPIGGGAFVYGTENGHATNLTGTINAEIDLSLFTCCPPPALSNADHYYTITVNFLAWTPAPCDVGECRLVSYPMSTSPNATGGLARHVVEWRDYCRPTCAPPLRSEVVEMAPWVEVYEKTATGTESHSDVNPARLVLATLLVAGIVLVAVAVAAPVAIPVLAAEAVGIGFAGVGLIGIAEVGGILLTNPGPLHEAVAAGKGLLAAGACTLAVASPFLPVKTGAKVAIGVASAAGCYVLTDPDGPVAGLSDLLDLGLTIFRLVKKAVEVAGAILANLLQWIAPVVISFDILILIALAFAGIGLVKLVLVAVYAGLASAMGYDRPMKWHRFRRIYTTYIPLWTELVEQRLFGMGVKP